MGPSCDGGYYLLGIKRPHRRLFEDVDWSTDRVARQSIERAQELGLEVYELPVWYDVDDRDTLRLLHAELFGGRSFNRDLMPYRASHAAALMRCLSADSDFSQRLGVASSLAPAGLVEPRLATPVNAVVAAEAS
jgi:hypothetical protein